MAESPRRRAEDYSALQRANHFLAQWRLIVYLLVGLLVALGWKWEGPGTRLKTAEANIQDLQNGQDSINSAISVLVRLRCFDRDVSDQERALAGLDCSDMLSARRRDSLKTSKALPQGF